MNERGIRATPSALVLGAGGYDAPATIVIPTWTRRSMLRRLLFSIARQQGHERLEVIVADSHSPDGTAAMVAAFSRRVRPVRLVQTVNALAAKRNAGARSATHEVLVFLDDDLRFADRGSMAGILAEAAREDVPVCFRVDYPPDWRRQSLYYRFKQLAHDRTNNGPRKLESMRFVAMAFCIRKATYWRVGGFSEDYVGYGGEDHDFELALASIGITAVLSEGASVLHCEDSRSFDRYRMKLVTTAAEAMPILRRRWPGKLDHSHLSVLEGALVRTLVGWLPVSLFRAASRGSAWLMDNLPRGVSDRTLRRFGRVFSGFAYLQGMCARDRR